MYILKSLNMYNFIKKKNYTYEMKEYLDLQHHKSQLKSINL